MSSGFNTTSLPQFNSKISKFDSHPNCLEGSRLFCHFSKSLSWRSKRGLITPHWKKRKHTGLNSTSTQSKKQEEKATVCLLYNVPPVLHIVLPSSVNRLSHLPPFQTKAFFKRKKCHKFHKSRLKDTFCLSTFERHDRKNINFQFHDNSWLMPTQLIQTLCAFAWNCLTSRDKG